MSLDLEDMPLFPLNAVLLPYQALPLNVFEDRYITMIEECRQNDQTFGVVLIREGEEVGDSDVIPYNVGTSARVITEATAETGGLVLVAVGERRFRVRKFDYSKPYLVGRVEPIIELEWEDSPSNESLIEQAKGAFLSHLSTMFGGQEVNLNVRFTDDPVALSFAMAGCLHLTVLQKQRLLELTDTAERIREIIPALESHTFELVAESPPTTEEIFREFISRN